jgi:hypothetical protein
LDYLVDWWRWKPYAFYFRDYYNVIYYRAPWTARKCLKKEEYSIDTQDDIIVNKNKQCATAFIFGISQSLKYINY